LDRAGFVAQGYGLGLEEVLDLEAFVGGLSLEEMKAYAAVE
jgi:hypothetical protein